MKFIAKSVIYAACAAALASCMSVDKEVAQKPTRYWKAPKDALPASPIEPEQIRTDEIVSKDKISPASAKIQKGDILTLPDLLDIALENNTSTRQYWYQSKIYAAKKGEANSQYYPTVNLGAQVYRAKLRSVTLNSLGTPPVGSYYETGYGPTLELNWLLYDFGQREALVDVARENLRAANFDYNQSIQDVALNVNLAYFQLYEAMGSVDAAKASLQDAETAYDSAKVRLDNGVGNKQDMLMALANAKNAEYVLEKAQAEVERQRAALAAVLGIRVSNFIKISGDSKVSESAPLAEKKVEDLMATALNDRQTMLASYAALRSTAAQTKAAERNFLPSIGAVASGTWTDYSGNTYTGSPAYEYAAGFQLSWEIFDGFTKQYQLINANAQQRAQAQKLKELEIRIISDVWTYFYAYKSAVKQVVSTKAAVVANEQAYEAVKIAYENGVSNLVNLLTAQSNLATARQQEVSARAFLSTSLAQLAHATGKLLLNTEADADLSSNSI